MGKGDRRTRRGKIWRGTHGKRRPASEEGRRAKSGTGPESTRSVRPPGEGRQVSEVRRRRG